MIFVIQHQSLAVKVFKDRGKNRITLCVYFHNFSELSFQRITTWICLIFWRVYTSYRGRPGCKISAYSPTIMNEVISDFRQFLQRISGIIHHEVTTVYFRIFAI